MGQERVLRATSNKIGPKYNLYRCHKVILAASCELFNKLFTDTADHSVIKKLTLPKIIEPLSVKEPVKAEAKPAEAKPAEAKPAEAKPAEAKPVEAKPAEVKPEAADAKKAEAPKIVEPPKPLTDPVEIVLKYIYNN